MGAESNIQKWNDCHCSAKRLLYRFRQRMAHTQNTTLLDVLTCLSAGPPSIGSCFDFESQFQIHYPTVLLKHLIKALSLLSQLWQKLKDKKVFTEGRISFKNLTNLEITLKDYFSPQHLVKLASPDMCHLACLLDGAFNQWLRYNSLNL